MNNIIISSINGDYNIVKNILDTNNFSFIDDDGLTALMHAAGNNHIEIVKLFISFFNYNSKIYTKKCNCNPPHNKSCNIYDINYISNKGVTALSIAINQRHINIVKLLLEYGAIIIFDNVQTESAQATWPVPTTTYKDFKYNSCDNVIYKHTIFCCEESKLIYYHMLSMFIKNCDDLHIITILLKNDNRLFKLNNIGIYFIFACSDNNIELVLLYLNNNFNINYIHNNKTCLIEAIKYNNIDIVILLISFSLQYNIKLNIYYKDIYNKSAIDYSLNNDKLYKLLNDYINACNNII